MSNLVCRIATLAVLIAVAQNIGAVGQPAGFAPAVTGNWGFDLFGADFATNPGDDFFRYSNGAWYDQAVIPPDRSSNGVFTALSITAEARIREILQRGEESVDPLARADATKISAFYAAFMNEARAEALDAQPIAPLIHMIRAASTREELADLMGIGGRSFFRSVFSSSIGPDDKTPDKYVVSIGQGGLGLNRDYYLTPRLADKKEAYLAYITQLLGMIGWEAPERSAAAILAFETAIAEVSWTNAERRDPEKTYNPMNVAALDAAAAGAAAPGPVDRDGVAPLEPVHPRAGLLDPAGVLVAERERDRVRQRSLRPLHHVEVRVAGAGAADLDQDLARPRLGNVDVEEPWGLLPLQQAVGLHSASSLPPSSASGSAPLSPSTLP